MGIETINAMTRETVESNEKRIAALESKINQLEAQGFNVSRLRLELVKAKDITNRLRATL